MRRNAIYFLVVLFIGLGGLAWYGLNRPDEKMSAILADRDFAIEDIEDVGKIFLAGRDTTPNTLELINGTWMINAKYKANPNAVNNLLETLRDIKMQSIPPKGHVKGIMEGLAVFGIKVEIYSRKLKKLKTYYVGSGTHSEYGTYFYMENGQQPYIMEIPHFSGNVRERYDLSELDWRDRGVMDVDYQDIEAVQVSYLDEKSESFTIRKIENRLKLFDFANQEISLNSKAKKTVENYLKEFPDVGAEAIQNDHPQRKLLEELEPFCTIEIKRLSNPNPLICKFYPIEIDSVGEASQEVKQTHLKRAEFFRMHVIRSDGDFLLVQYPVVEKLFRTRQSFQ